MAKQIILTQNNFGIPIELQFMSNTNSPIDLTGKTVEVAISYDGTIIDVLQATISSYTNGTVYIVTTTKHTSNVGLYTTFWSVKDKNGYITAQEDLYYYVKGEYNGAENNDIEQDKETMEETIITNVLNSLNATIENNKLDIESKLNNYKEENNNNLNNSINELNEKYNLNKQEIDNNLNTINNNLSNYMLKSDLITETGSIALGENIKIAADQDGKQLFTLEKNKEGIIIGNITVSTVNGANDITHGKLLFTLNENYRPSHQIIIPCYCSRTSQPDKIIGVISIYEDGRVLINLFEKSPEGDIYPVESVYINFFIKVS